MKRIILALVVVACLAGCGSSGNTTAPTTAPATTEGEYVPPDTITYSCEGEGAGAQITYGPEDQQSDATGVPFLHSDELDPAVRTYGVEVEVRGDGDRVTCTISLMKRGLHIAQNIGTALGAGDVVRVRLCANSAGDWRAC